MDAKLCGFCFCIFATAFFGKQVFDLIKFKLKGSDSGYNFIYALKDLVKVRVAQNIKFMQKPVQRLC